jgi:hypothetical protein
MLTRKRTQERLYYQKLKAYTYEFNPILESVSKFLNNNDCASVSNLNQECNTKTWIVVLNCVSRVNTYIHVNETSRSWIVKYQQHLKYQKLRISSNFTKFFQIPILSVDTLTIDNCDTIVRVPKHTRELRLYNFKGIFPKLNGIKYLVLQEGKTSFDLSKLPSSLIDLSLIYTTFDVMEIPTLSNLITLTLKNCPEFLNMGQLHIKCPNIRTLIIEDEFANDLDGLQELQVQCLIIDSINFLVNLDCLKTAKVNHLFFSKNCTWIPPMARQPLTSNLHHIKDIQFLI